MKENSAKKEAWKKDKDFKKEQPSLRKNFKLKIKSILTE